MRGGYDPDRAALILADANVLGDAAAATKWKVSLRTVARYRARASAEPGLAQLVREKQTEDARTLSELRVAYMRDALEAMRGKLESASLFEVAGSIKIVGELHQVAEALAEDDEDDDGEPYNRGRANQEDALRTASQAPGAAH